MKSTYKTYTVLIVEDDADIREALVDELSHIQNIKSVVVAVDGVLATQRINNQVFDLIVLDYKLPKMTGLDILRQYGNNFKEKGTKVLFISGYLDPTVLNKAVQLGVRKVMVKPFTPDEFISAVSKILDLD